MNEPPTQDDRQGNPFKKESGRISKRSEVQNYSSHPIGPENAQLEINIDSCSQPKEREIERNSGSQRQEIYGQGSSGSGSNQMNQHHNAKNKKRNFLCCHRKRKKESCVKPRTLLPACINSVEELRKHYKRKLTIKKESHLNIPEILKGRSPNRREDPSEEPSRVEDLKTLFAISRDSCCILAATSPQEIKCYDSQTHNEVQPSLRFPNEISCFALSPNNKFLVVGFVDKSVEIFHFENLKQKRQENNSLYHSCRDLYDSLATIAITEDSRYIVSVSGLNNITIFDIKEKRIVNIFPSVHHETISCMTATADCKFLISASHDKSTKILDIVTGREVYHFKDVLHGVVTSVAVSPNNKFLLTGSDDLSIRIFDLETKQLIHEFTDIHDDRITTLSIASNNRYVASGSADCSIKILDLETKQLISSLSKIHTEEVFNVKFAPNNKFLVSMSCFGSMKIINFETALVKKQLKGSGELVTIISKRNQEIIIFSTDNGLHGINIETGDKVFQIPAARQESITSVAVSLDNNFLLCGTDKGNIEIIDLGADPPKSHSLINGIHGDTPVTAVALTDDNKYIVSSSDNGLKVTDWKNNREHHSFPPLRQCRMLQKITVIPKSQFIAVGLGKQSIKILDTENKIQAYKFKNVHRRPITCIAVTCDGRFLVSGSEGRSIKIFDLKVKQLVHSFQNAHTNKIYSLAVSTYNDCTIIVSGSFDGSIKIFDLQTRQQVYYFKDYYAGPIKSLAITSDNKYVVPYSTGLPDIKLLDLTSLSLLPTSKFINSTVKKSEFDLDAVESEISYAYSGFSHYCIFNSVDGFLFDENMPIQSIREIAVQCSNLTVYPYRWNILHLVAIKEQYSFIKNMPEYAKFKVPFLLDTFSKTPLYYLIAHPQKNFPCINIMLKYICDYLEDIIEAASYEAQQIAISLDPLFWYILTKTDIKTRVRFFNLCSKVLPLPYDKELPVFGETNTDAACVCPSLDSIYSSLSVLQRPGEDPIHFRCHLINMDYNVLSDEITETVKHLLEQRDEDIFEAAFIVDLIDFIWNQAKWFLAFQLLVFSAYVLILSVYFSQEDTSFGAELAILCSSLPLLLVQVLQICFLKRDFFMDKLNYSNVIFHLLTIGYVIARIVGVEDELWMQWISAIILLFVYFRLICYLRIWKPTRNFIQAIATVLQDMPGFVFIIALIIVCFSFIYFVFNKGHLYGFYLNEAFHSLFGPIDREDPNLSEIIFIDLAAFLLFVVFLNLLIAVMVESYNKVMKERIKTDSKTRLVMIQEAIPLLYWLPCFRPKKGFLCRVKSVDSPDGKKDKFEGPFRELVKHSENSIVNEIQKALQSLQQNLARIDHKINANEERIIVSENRVLAQLEKLIKNN